MKEKVGFGELKGKVGLLEERFNDVEGEGEDEGRGSVAFAAEPGLLNTNLFGSMLGAGEDSTLTVSLTKFGESSNGGLTSSSRLGSS